MRRLVLAVVALVAFASSAAAGDYADREIIGFSPDGRYFAFEEYGIQDGSGFPYSNIYLIETSTDSWVSGSPYRVRLDSETATVAAARTQARSMASDALASRGVGLPGRILVSNPLTEVSTDTHVVDFLTMVFVPPQVESNRLTLTERPLEVKSCPTDLGTIVGFDLTLRTVDGTVLTLNSDTAIPSSRACPVGYGISEVIAFDGAPSGDTILIVLVDVFRIGFEGPDRRFLAIATSVPPLF